MTLFEFYIIEIILYHSTQQIKTAEAASAFSGLVPVQVER
jgi:hypothetical protein